MLQRFVREARVVNQIRHPNIVDVYDFGMLPDGSPYYVMELLPGRTLSQLLQERGRLSPGAGAGVPGARLRGAGGGAPARAWCTGTSRRATWRWCPRESRRG